MRYNILYICIYIYTIGNLTAYICKKTTFSPPYIQYYVYYNVFIFLDM